MFVSYGRLFAAKYDISPRYRHNMKKRLHCGNKEMHRITKTRQEENYDMQWPAGANQKMRQNTTT